MFLLEWYGIDTVVHAKFNNYQKKEKTKATTSHQYGWYSTTSLHQYTLVETDTYQYKEFFQHLSSHTDVGFM